MTNFFFQPQKNQNIFRWDKCLRSLQKRKKVDKWFVLDAVITTVFVSNFNNINKLYYSKIAGKIGN